MYPLSERQAGALANMETFAGIRRPQTEFPDREAFQAYWDQLVRRGEATKRETPALRAEKRQQREERIATYYQDITHLCAYGQQYAQRYQPSSGKLRQQLAAKSRNSELVDQAMERLAERLHDDARARELAEMMQQQGRHAQAIRSKLRQRLFTAEVIERCLTSMTEATGSLLNTASLIRKVQKLQRKGLSQRAMRSKLMGSSADSLIVQATLDDTLGENGDDLALRTAIDRLARKQLDRRALIQRLTGKGFRYADVVRILTAMAESVASPHA